MIGQTLSHYKIISKLGQGGFGEVYLAEDSRLDRKVALKILPQHLSERAELRERFEREARAVSSLNHPHICTLYDIGEQDGIHYLVMEHLVGETLEARLAKGALPLDQTLEYAIQIADALDKAHRQGVVHRDLKPANIMLVKSGAKLLDFGLAKLQAADTPTNLSALPTEQANLTAEGTILGTLQYMAPEQLEGKEADSRTDIFAFGAVVYEMATGKKAFEGKSQASLIGAIMQTDPRPMSALQPMTPPTLDHVVRRCMSKAPEGRWQAASDVMTELRWVTEVGTQPDAPPPVSARSKSRERLMGGLVVGLATALAVALLAPYFTGESNQLHSIQFLVSPPGVHAISPNGRHLALVRPDPDGPNMIHIRPLNSTEMRPLLGTEGVDVPSGLFWSPDSRYIGFFSQGKLKKIDFSGGPPQTLCDATTARGGSWSREGVILFGLQADVLYKVSEDGGQPPPVTTFGERGQTISHNWPQFLPDGKHFIFLSQARIPEDSSIEVGSLDSLDRKTLVGSAVKARYASGYLLFIRAEVLMAQKFDERSLQTVGGPLTVADNLRTDLGIGQGIFSVSEQGVLTYATGQLLGSQLEWFDRSGHKSGTVGELGWYSNPVVSPDGSVVAVERQGSPEASSDIWLFDLSKGTSSRFTFDPGTEKFPTWLSDGSSIIFSSIRQEGSNLYRKGADSSEPEKSIFDSTGDVKRPDSSLGELLIYSLSSPDTRSDIWTLSLSDDPSPQSVLQGPSSEITGRLTPNGQWIAYASDESGRFEIYVQSFPPSGAKWQISHESGLQPNWREDGKELFYITYQGDVTAVEVETESKFTHGSSQPLFRVNTNLSLQRNTFDVASDGQRFLINSAIREDTSAITVVTNWTAELDQ